MTNTFDPRNLFGTIAIVGLGGTGAQVARSVARMVYDLKTNGAYQVPSILLIDPDIVEEKNVGRQLYTEADIGHYKADVLMRRFNQALGLSISAITQPFDANFVEYGSVLVGAVDNHLARRELHKYKGVWIDAGNHFDSGQVIIGNLNDHRTALNYLSGAPSGQFPNLPNAGLIFPSLLEPETPKAQPVDVSCADLVASREQDLFINDWMAMVTSQYIYKLLHRQPIHSFMSYISAESMSVRSVPIDADSLKSYLEN